MNKTTLITLSLVIGLYTYGQEIQTSIDTLRTEALNVFMDASDYIRKEIPYINYVRDIKDADVYIISTYQPTGSGGREYAYYLVGQHEYSGKRDTISFTTTPDETEDGKRKKETSTLKMALMPYVAKTPLAKYINITFTEPLSETISTDKWDSWVFSPSTRAFLLGEKSYKSSSLNARLEANRITENWKINLALSYSYYKESFDIEEEIISSDRNSSYFNSLVVKSISDHWSVGGSLEFSSSTYNNLNFKSEILPGIEYDLFPYSESTRRQLRFLYRAGYSFVNYTDTIIHDQLGLVKGGVSPEEVLLRRRDLETQYYYYTSIGFSYTFGSIYNNVVNPRFGDSW